MGTGSGPACTPARTAPRAPGPGSSRRPKPSAAARTGHAGGADAGGGHGRGRSRPLPSPPHRTAPPRRRHTARPHGGRGLTCLEQDSGTTVSSGSAHTTSGLFTFCMFPNSTGLKGTPETGTAFSRAGGRPEALPAPARGGPRGGAHPRRGTPSRSAGRCSPRRGRTCGSGTYCPARAAGGGGR